VAGQPAILYTALADLTGKLGRRERDLVGSDPRPGQADDSREWVGLDVPVQRLLAPDAKNGDKPFIMRADCGALRPAPTGLPRHYEPVERRRESLSGQQINPVRKIWRCPTRRTLAPVGSRYRLSRRTA